MNTIKVIKKTSTNCLLVSQQVSTLLAVLFFLFFMRPTNILTCHVFVVRNTLDHTRDFSEDEQKQFFVTFLLGFMLTDYFSSLLLSFGIWYLYLSHKSNILSYSNDVQHFHII